MICRLNLEKSVFKLMQNLTSKLHCSGFLSSRKVFSSCSWWHSHHYLFSVLWTFYPFRSIFLVYLSQGLYAPFFCTYLTLRQLFSGKSSWIFHGTLWCVLLGRMTPSYTFHPRTISIIPNMYKRKVREAFEINRLKALKETDKIFKVLNRDNGDYITTNSWRPLFRKIGNH